MNAQSFPHPDVPADPAREKTVERRRAPAAGAPSQVAGTLWFIGCLFTIGFVELVWWKALLALPFWPYFLGVALR